MSILLPPGGFPKENPEVFPSAASVGNPDPNPADTGGACAPNVGLLNMKPAGFGGSGAAAGGWPNENPEETGLGSSGLEAMPPNEKPVVVGLGASIAFGAPPNVNEGAEAAGAFPNIPLGGGAAGAAEPPKLKLVDAGLSAVVVPKPQKLWAVALGALPFAFPNMPPLDGAAFEPPNIGAELWFPNMPAPPFIPLVGADGAKLAKGFGLGCSC